jgi:hypothetical protein
VRATWHAGENYGIAAKLSGLVVVDLDTRKPGYEYPERWRNWRDEPGIVDGRDVLAALAERCSASSWPHTFTVSTPSGGLHLYFTALIGRPIGNRPLGPMIDIRGGGTGNGGYVLGPGSILNGCAYEVRDGQEPAPLPAWIADLLDPPRREPAASARTVARPADRVGARLDALLVAVTGAQPGERNNVLHWAACRAAEMIAAGELAEDQVSDSLAAAAGRAGLDDSEARRTIASAFRRTLRKAS